MKKLILIMIIAILTLGAVTAVYASENNTNDSDYGSSMMDQNNISNDNYNKMIDLMNENGFQDSAKAMKNRDFNSMSDIMNNLTDNQYNQMIDIMRDNGHEGIANIMSSVSREDMLNTHNSMMGR